jgi:hypothetical protein
MSGAHPIKSEYIEVWHRVQEDLLAFIYLELDSIKDSDGLLHITRKSDDRKKLLGNIQAALVTIGLFKSRIDDGDLREQIEAEVKYLTGQIFPNTN